MVGGGEEETREAALTQIKQHLTAYLSQAPEVLPIELASSAAAEHPWLQFAGMWADDPTWDDLVTEVAAYRQEMDAADTEKDSLLPRSSPPVCGDFYREK